MQDFRMKPEGDQMHISGDLRPPTLHEVAGYASFESSGDQPMIVFFVAAGLPRR